MIFLVILTLLCSAVTVFSEDCKPGTCQSDETCCPTAIPGDYSCCPFENAVCCADHTYCCPQGTECDIITGSCHPKVGRGANIQSLDKLGKRVGGFDEETFSDGCKPGTCDVGETCCPTAIPGDYSCCPYPNAVCCVDHTFCCPQDTECDIIAGTCIPTETIENKLENRQGVYYEDETIKRQCGDGALCPYDSTCCPILTEGKFGCCPHLNGICCPDKIHCCPQDQVCDVTSRFCVHKRTAHGSEVKEPALPLQEESTPFDKFSEDLVHLGDLSDQTD